MTLEEQIVNTKVRVIIDPKLFADLPFGVRRQLIKVINSRKWQDSMLRSSIQSHKGDEAYPSVVRLIVGPGLMPGQLRAGVEY